jgi:hypothetical protein
MLSVFLLPHKQSRQILDVVDETGILTALSQPVENMIVLNALATLCIEAITYPTYIVTHEHCWESCTVCLSYGFPYDTVST